MNTYEIFVWGTFNNALMTVLGVCACMFSFHRCQFHVVGVFPLWVVVLHQYLKPPSKTARKGKN